MSDHATETRPDRTAPPAQGPTARKRTFCGVCEASCGIIVETRGDEVVSIAPDPEHPNSKGFACSKGVQFHHVRDDEDRVTRPLRRRADGGFEPIAWDTALSEIGARMSDLIRTHGTQSVGLIGGNPIAWNFAAFVQLFNTAAALKTKHLYISSSVDINNYWVVGQLLYGNSFTTFFPDLPRTKFMLILGANPLVTHGSMMTVGQIRKELRGVEARGGRVVVLDPRRSETAELFEHRFIRPDSDPWLVAAMIKIAFRDNLVDHAAVGRQANGLDFARALVEGVDLERASAETGIAQEDITQLTRDFCAAESAALYGRWGASLGQFSTLTKYLIDVFNLISGNVDRPGGAVLGHSQLDNELLMMLAGQIGYDRWRTRVENLPEVAGTSPWGAMAAEIETPGDGQLRAALVTHANPVVNGPDGERLEKALESLDLFVALDPYITDTSRCADYILPPTLWLEREGFPIFTMSHTATPYAQWSAATVSPVGEARDDWWIMNQIFRRAGVIASPFRAVRWLGKLGVHFTPRFLVDVFMRIGADGDWFGLRRKGLNRRKLVEGGAPLKLMDQPPTGVLRKRLYTRSRRIELRHSIFEDEMRRMIERRKRDDEYPMQIISIRELRSQNSWLHNVDKLMAGGRRQWLKIHPEDARAHLIRDGDIVRVESRHGVIEVQARLSEEMMRGVVGLPSGWGHRGGWRRAVAAGGAVYNHLISGKAEHADRLSGQTQLTGVAIRLSRIGANATSAEALEEV